MHRPPRSDPNRTDAIPPHDGSRTARWLVRLGALTDGMGPWTLLWAPWTLRTSDARRRGAS